MCGAPSASFRGGWGRRCTGCGAEHFPRVDPVVIMLAEHQERVLVARQPQYPSGRYSALAGFVEPGESIEEAVARELMEEAGVMVGNVRYVASQPWPFPGSLMIACLAEAD
jgi:NAD+ diphosphatase